MKHGGKRNNSGRSKIKGRELKIKIPEETYLNVKEKFLGNTIQDKIRDCLEYGIEKKDNYSSNIQDLKYNVLDLFSGAGGLSLGLMQAGFNIVLGVDFDDSALKTFKINHGNSDILNLDLFDHKNIYIIKDYLKNRNIDLDVLVGGPPCQGFSLAGKRNEFDKRNALYSAMVKTAKILQPKVVVLENVPGMMTLYNGAGAKRVKEDFEEIGFRVMKPQILYAPEYGIPQIRRRVFFVMVNDKTIRNNFEYPIPTHDENDFVTTGEAIGNLPSLEGLNNYDLSQIFEYNNPPINNYEKYLRNGSTKIHNHIPTNHAKETIRLISLVPEGKNFRSLPPEELEKRKFKYNEALTRYDRNKPSRTIDTGHRTHFHYKYNRIPTVREAARLQSFPDDFIFYGNKQEQYRQVGNAVPPILGKAIGEKIKELLENEKI